MKFYCSNLKKKGHALVTVVKYGPKEDAVTAKNLTFVTTWQIRWIASDDVRRTLLGDLMANRLSNDNPMIEY